MSVFATRVGDSTSATLGAAGDGAVSTAGHQVVIMQRGPAQHTTEGDTTNTLNTQSDDVTTSGAVEEGLVINTTDHDSGSADITEQHIVKIEESGMNGEGLVMLSEGHAAEMTCHEEELDVSGDNETVVQVTLLPPATARQQSRVTFSQEVLEHEEVTSLHPQEVTMQSENEAEEEVDVTNEEDGGHIESPPTKRKKSN